MTLDTSGDAGTFTSIAIGSDGNPVVAYQHVGAQNLKVAHCDDAQCQSVTTSTVDFATDTGAFTSIAIGIDGLPIISYHDVTNTSLRVAHCDDVACLTATTTTLDDSADVGSHTSIAIGADGLPIISYYDATSGDLEVAHCDDVACTSAGLADHRFVGRPGPVHLDRHRLRRSADHQLLRRDQRRPEGGPLWRPRLHDRNDTARRHAQRRRYQ